MRLLNRRIIERVHKKVCRLKRHHRHRDEKLICPLKGRL